MRPTTVIAIVCAAVIITSIPSHTEWIENGIPVCSAIGDQFYPQIISGEDGNSIITWHDNRSGNSDIYIQKIDSDGIPQWQYDGLAVCTATGDQWHPRIASDSKGGAIITWWDNRNGTWNVYAQRINPTGSPMWPIDGVAVSSSTGWTEWGHGPAEIIQDEMGGSIITWRNNYESNIHIYAQRIDSTGALLWDETGIPICTADGNKIQQRIITDNIGGAIISWTDYRNTNSDIYAQRINSSGTTLWAYNGIAVCANPQYQYDPSIAIDYNNGAVITWWDFRNGGGDIFAQRIESNGLISWASDGIPICDAPGDQGYYNLQITATNNDNLMVVWEDMRNSNWDIYAQNIDIYGNTYWPPNGIPVCDAAGDQGYHYQGSYAIDVVPDTSGGIIITWVDTRNGSLDVYANKIDPNGIQLWDHNGVVICSADNVQDFPRVALDEYQNTHITWHDYRYNNFDIYTIGISPTGELLDNEIIIYGNVNSDCIGPLAGVTIDAFQKETGILISSTSSNSTGEYEFEPLLPNEYIITIVSPLGFNAFYDEYIIAGIAGDTLNIDFNLTCLNITLGQRSIGFWKHQVGVALGGHGETQIDAATLCDYLDLIEVHFNSNAINQVIVYDPPDQASCDDKLETAKTLLNLKGNVGMAARAKQQLMALLMNVASVKLSLTEIISEDGATVSQAITYCDLLIDDEIEDNDEVAKDVANMINTSQMVPEGMIPSSISFIAYSRSKAYLAQNYPNPFNPSTTIKFTLRSRSHVSLKVYNVAGQLIRTLLDEPREEGTYMDVHWDGRNNNNQQVPIGIYFCKMTTMFGTQTRKIVLIQ